MAAFQIPQNPTLGLCISTHGTPGNVALHLEAMKRFNPGVATLVVDDCSSDGSELIDLCRGYGAEFISNPRRCGHFHGDLAAFAHGLRWAKLRGFDLLVKMSRRWIPLKPWVDQFKLLSVMAQHATYSSRCNYCNYGFRTECLGLAVDAWFPFLPTINAGIEAQEETLVEAFLHQRIAQHIEVSDDARQFVGIDPGYCVWGLMGDNRFQPPEHILWHDVMDRGVYQHHALLYGLDYGIESF